MRWVDGRHDLRIGNNQVIDDQIGDQRADVLLVVIDQKLFLLLNWMSTLAEFNHKYPLVELLVAKRAMTKTIWNRCMVGPGEVVQFTQIVEKMYVPVRGLLGLPISQSFPISVPKTNTGT